MDYYDYHNNHYDNDYYYSQYQNKRFERMIEEAIASRRKNVEAMYSFNK